ncbi:photosynthetic complex assembly protein PuhC [Aestuariibius sp. 2305UL40-4]|uniref:photosynthetic complex assembly protein PuhC n=1 Tax=Aestuariibius violaceus TaxID=3234132 RepID=UPI00345E832C
MSNLEAQMKLRDKEMVPRILVRAMFALMVASLALVSYATLTDRPKVGTLPASTVAKEVIVTLDMSERERVIVLDTAGAELARSDDTRMGFLGVIGRAVDRERVTHGADRSAPVRVARLENGHIAIFDDETDWSVELVGYGKDNVAAFAALVD